MKGLLADQTVMRIKSRKYNSGEIKNEKVHLYTCTLVQLANVIKDHKISLVFIHLKYMFSNKLIKVIIVHITIVSFKDFRLIFFKTS